MTSLFTLINALLKNKWRQSFGLQHQPQTIITMCLLLLSILCKTLTHFALPTYNLLFLAIPSVQNTIFLALYRHRNQPQPTRSCLLRFHLINGFPSSSEFFLPYSPTIPSSICSTWSLPPLHYDYQVILPFSYTSWLRQTSVICPPKYENHFK